MAKPGSNGARMLSGRDLSSAGLTDLQARKVQEEVELRQGMRCSGCGRRITVGFQFTSIDPRASVAIMKLSACARDDCGFAEDCREGATFMEMVEFAWLDEMAADAPAAVVIVERNEQRAAREAQTPPSG